MLACISIDSNLLFFITNYFVKPQIQKTFFLGDEVISGLSLEKKMQLFKKLCEREGFDEHTVKETIARIKFVQELRNKVAHWERFSIAGDIVLKKPKSYMSEKDTVKLDDKTMELLEQNRVAAQTGINQFYLQYQKEGTIDERSTSLENRKG